MTIYSSDGLAQAHGIPASALEDCAAHLRRQLDYQLGIYRLSPAGELELLYRDQHGQTGIAGPLAG